MNYKLLGKSGLRVSELCLGTMTFGEEWGWGASKEECRKMFDMFSEAGGNFIDTANLYTNGTSEIYVGDFVAGERERFVVASKYTLSTRQGDINSGGNHRKNLVQSVEASLKRMKLDYMDLLWVHAWDCVTPIEEMMRALDDLVRAGKILYTGISDAPAWVVAKANTIADFRGWTPFTALQTQYSLVERTSESDILPMARDFDIGVTAWSPLASGVLTGKYNKDDGQPKRIDPANPMFAHYLSERNLAIAGEVVKIAAEIGRSPAQVALTWLRQQKTGPGGIIPIIGARKASQFEDNLKCLEFELSSEQLKTLDESSSYQQGFPHYFLNSDGVKGMIFGGFADQLENHRE